MTNAIHKIVWISIGVASLAIIAFGIYAWALNITPGTPVPVATNTALPDPQNVSTSSGPATLPSKGTTNADLSKDLTSINTQLSGLSADNQTVSQSIATQTPTTAP